MQLSTADEAEAHFQAEGQPRSWSVTEARFAQLVEPLLQRVRKPIERAMRDARISVSDLSEVVLVGGASRMPSVVKMVTRMFGRLPLRHVNPDEAIARGAAVAAGMKARHAALEEIVMTDVCPYTLGVAVAIEDGLITPVIRDAHRKGITEIAREVKELAGRAREKKLTPEEYTGSTFSISNLGMFGITEFTAIINPPEAAILAVGAIEEKPVAEGGEVTIRPRMRMTLSCDHRVIDGATGAQFLQTLQRYLEDPMMMIA
jgi:pyruvate dehydrogenase E2 component (dihydrolipoamide acetyltransferase)